MTYGQVTRVNAEEDSSVTSSCFVLQFLTNTLFRVTYYERIILKRFLKEWDLDLSCCGYGAKGGL
jgi:hypothetical protein